MGKSSIWIRQMLDSTLLQTGIVNFLNSRISFAAVGTGCNFFKNGYGSVPEHYAKYAISSYSLFALELLDKDIGIPPLINEGITSKLTKLDKQTWKLFG
jgi:hypothetical protein